MPCARPDSQRVDNNHNNNDNSDSNTNTANNNDNNPKPPKSGILSAWKRPSRRGGVGEVAARVRYYYYYYYYAQACR